MNDRAAVRAFVKLAVELGYEKPIAPIVGDSGGDRVVFDYVYSDEIGREVLLRARVLDDELEVIPSLW